MVRKEIASILQSPNDGTPLNESLQSETGAQYGLNDDGVLMLDSNVNRKMDGVYTHPMWARWEAILEERLNYYTGKKTVAGRVADSSHGELVKIESSLGQDDLIVDIGCGDGSEAYKLQRRENYIGIDRNLSRLAILKSRFPEATAIYCDAARLPFRANSVKYIYSAHAFEHLWYLKEAVYETSRVLAEGGGMTIVVPTEGGLWNLGRKLYSKPFFQKRHPTIDFELISHLEHCNNATQIMRTLETFFETRVEFWPLRLPSVYLNAIARIHCRHFSDSARRIPII